MGWNAYDYPLSKAEPDASPVGFPRSIDYDIGYITALNDVLKRIRVEGKEGLVYWLEQKVKALP